MTTESSGLIYRPLGLFADKIMRSIVCSSGAIKTYYKTLKAKSKRVLTRVRKEGLPQVANKQEESVITARRNQRCHNVSEKRVFVDTRNLSIKSCLRWPNTVFKSLCLILHNF